MSPDAKGWVVYVPTVKPAWFPGKKRFFSKKYHKLWDQKVLAVSGGLTITKPDKGKWVSLSGEVVEERVIRVKIDCTREQIEQIRDITAEHYRQVAVLIEMVCPEVSIKYYPENELIDKGE